MRQFPELQFTSGDLNAVGEVQSAKAIKSRELTITNETNSVDESDLIGGFGDTFNHTYDRLIVCYDTELIEVNDMKFTLSLLNSDAHQ